MKMSIFAYTITVKKRESTVAEAMRKEHLRRVQDAIIDKRVQHNLYN